MENIEKTCKIHGVLEEVDILKHKTDERYKKGYTLRCRKCVDERTWRDWATCKKHGKLGPEDMYSRGRCKHCHKDYMDIVRNNNRAAFNEKMAKDREANPEKWAAAYKRNYANNKAKYGQERVSREICRMKGLTSDQYEKMFLDQDHKCKICNKPETRASRTRGNISRLSVDHCHGTGLVRGLLCYKCNSMLGFVGDSIEVLCNAIDYLLDHQDLAATVSDEA